MADAEMERLRALHDFAVLDTLPEARFDRLTTLAADLFEAPIALVSLIDQNRQWFKSRVGFDVVETPRAWAFCGEAIMAGEHAIIVVEDASLDPHFAANPLVTGEAHIRFYLGATLTTAGGLNVGTLCVMDRHARECPSETDLKRLVALSKMVVDELEFSRSAHELAEQRRLLSLAEAMSGVGHWRYAVADRKITWSDEVYRIHGVDRASFDPNLGDNLAFYHPDDRDVVAALVGRSVANGEDFSFQLRLIVGDGEVRHVVSKASCDLDYTGATTAIIGVFQDVTAQVDRLAAVAQSEARYRLLADNASDMVAELKPDGRITYITPSCANILGYAPEEMVGRTLIDLVHPDDLDAVKAFYRNLTPDDPAGSEAMQFRARQKDGAWIWLEGQPKMFFDAETGKPLAMQDTVRDISKRKAMEVELDRARAEAEAASLVKSEFLANMSHELRTPLTSIVGFSTLLLNTVELDAVGRRYVERVTQASDALLTIVNDILDFSKLEAGQVEIENLPLDIKALVISTTELLMPQAQSKGLYLMVDCSDVPAAIVTDQARVRQVLLNMISNAVKFTVTGGVTVRARYNRQSQHLRCEIVDTGQGIAEDRIDRLFKRFSQVDASTTRSHGGTGLGLAICKGLAEAMGGSVGAESQPGQGSCFWMEIPCVMVDAYADTVAVEPQAEWADDVAPRVLVADDNPLNRELVRIILESNGVEVVDACSGSEALRLAHADLFDVILMDIRMPDVDGPTAAAEIRRSAGPNADTPIIAFSADVLDADTPGQRALFDGYLAKPLLAADLLAAVSGWGDGRQSIWPT